MFGYLLNFVWIPLVIVGARLSLTALIAIGACFGLGELGSFAAVFVLLRMANRETSRILGFKVGFLHTPPPPRTTEHYENWCRKYGVTPSAAGPEPADIRHSA